MKTTHYKFTLWIRQTFFLTVMILPAFSSCNKYLDAKPDQAIATPSTIEDLEGILNNYNFVNAKYPSAAEVSADDYYLTGTDWASLLDYQRAYYSWQKFNGPIGDYTSPYSAIEYANIILESLDKIGSTNTARTQAVKGNALYLRAAYHYALAQVFAPVYNKNTADSDLGVALRLTADIAIKPKRSTVGENYKQVIADLSNAAPLLPDYPDQKFRASKPAAYGMLARVYLAMGDYVNAGKYADAALKLYNKLINYNTVSATATIPFRQFNDEVIYDSRSGIPQALANTKAKIDTLLFSSYAPNDLRRTVLFKTNTNGSRAFKGSYTGVNNASAFTGIATNELYFIKSECAVRANDISTGLAALNTVLSTRWKTGTYQPVTITDAGLLLKTVLVERRKDLLFRTLRWTDLRRLNLEVDHRQEIRRNLNGTTYKLEPGSARYVFQIDQNAVEIGGLPQNP
nr:RagB/SusD family nutrient uptake outer membrane protein [uncultured Mucilaginibacter sp.]